MILNCCSYTDECSGPEETPFEGGVFVTELIFPIDYPLSPPKMKFVSDMFHPNGNYNSQHTLTFYHCLTLVQCTKMVEYVSQYCTHLVRIHLAMSHQQRGGAQFSPLRKYFSLLSVC